MPMITPHDARPIAERRTAKAGKFQGEPDYVESFWQTALEGLADWDLHDGDVLVSAFLIGDDDEAAWPGLIGCHALAVWEREDGFVCSMRFDRDGFETWRAALEDDGDDAGEAEELEY